MLFLLLAAVPFFRACVECYYVYDSLFLFYGSSMFAGNAAASILPVGVCSAGRWRLEDSTGANGEGLTQSATFTLAPGESSIPVKRSRDSRGACFVDHVTRSAPFRDHLKRVYCLSFRRLKSEWWFYRLVPVDDLLEEGRMKPHVEPGLCTCRDSFVLSRVAKTTLGTSVLIKILFRVLGRFDATYCDRYCFLAEKRSHCSSFSSPSSSSTSFFFSPSHGTCFKSYS